MTKQKPMIELAENFDVQRIKHWPVAVSQKYDGVPVRIINVGGVLVPYTRQGEVVTSIGHLLRVLQSYDIIALGGSITGELFIPNLPFKDISGAVRREEQTDERLELKVFDADAQDMPDLPYLTRLTAFTAALSQKEAFQGSYGVKIQTIPVALCNTVEEIEAVMQSVMEHGAFAEGVMVHDIHRPYRPGTRNFGNMRIVPEPVIDLKITGFEEAVEKGTKAGLGMVGRMIAELTYLNKEGKLVTTECGVGPGKTTHAERKLLWQSFTSGRYKPAIAKVKYKVDASYELLRQPTFQAWHTEKDEADVYYR